MKYLFKITLPKIILAFFITILPIGIRILLAVSSRLTPISAPDQSPYLIKIALYFSRALFFPFDILIGNSILASGVGLFRSSLYLGGTFPSLFIYLLYFLMQFVYSFVLSSIISIIIFQFQKNK